MAQKIAVPTADCGGIDVMTNGVHVASYDARGGIVEIENRDHADQIRATVGAGGQVFGFSRSTAPSLTCPQCNFSWFACFGEACRRCVRS
jgi:hypothetical protein